MSSELPSIPGVPINDYLVSAETPIKASVTETSLSAKEIIESANSIWQEVKASGVLAKISDPSQRAANEKKRDELLVMLQRRETDFQSSFPLVLRWMVQIGQYRQSAFHKYLLKYSKAIKDGLRNEEEYTKLQAEYLVLLFIELNPRTSLKEQQNYRQHLVDTLLAETKQFTKLQEEADKEIKQIAAASAERNRKQLYALLLAKKVESESLSHP